MTRELQLPWHLRWEQLQEVPWSKAPQSTDHYVDSRCVSWVVTHHVPLSKVWVWFVNRFQSIPTRTGKHIGDFPLCLQVSNPYDISQEWTIKEAAYPAKMDCVVKDWKVITQKTRTVISGKLKFEPNIDGIIKTSLWACWLWYHSGHCSWAARKWLR